MAGMQNQHTATGTDEERIMGRILHVISRGASSHLSPGTSTVSCWNGPLERSTPTHWGLADDSVLMGISVHTANELQEARFVSLQDTIFIYLSYHLLEQMPALIVHHLYQRCMNMYGGCHYCSVVKM